MNQIQDYIGRHVLVRWNQRIHVKILMYEGGQATGPIPTPQPL